MWQFGGALNADQETHALVLPDIYFGGGIMTAFLDDVSGAIQLSVTFIGLTGPATAVHGLIKLIEKSKRPITYTQFEDSIGIGEEISLPVSGVGLNYERFKEKARQFLKAHETHLAIQRLKRNKPITAVDLGELESMLLAEAGGRQELVDKAKEEASGLGLFVRSLVGLDRQAALEAMDAFLSDRAATANQLHFLRMIVDQLTIDGAMDPERLYEAPFTDIAAAGPDTVFPVNTVDRIIHTLKNIRNSAILAA